MGIGDFTQVDPDGKVRSRFMAWLVEMQWTRFGTGQRVQQTESQGLCHRLADNLGQIFVVREDPDGRLQLQSSCVGDDAWLLKVTKEANRRESCCERANRLARGQQ